MFGIGDENRRCFEPHAGNGEVLAMALAVCDETYV